MVESDSWFRLRWFLVGALAAVSTAFVLKPAPPAPAEAAPAPKVVAVPLPTSATDRVFHAISTFDAKPNDASGAEVLRAFDAAVEDLAPDARAAVERCLGQAATVPPASRASSWRACAAMLDRGQR